MVFIAALVAPAASHAFPTLEWPLEHAMNQGVLLGNYPDDDPASGPFHDYMNSNGTGDGHSGTDFGVHSFRAMDRGENVFAAASGVVSFKQDGKFDRNLGFPWPDDGNYLIIDHGDGSSASYLHLRKYSLTVDVGESVQAGQLLGLVGSSGYAWGPHLHFEVASHSPTWVPRDPWQGPGNPQPGLWESQAPYVWNDAILIHDAGVTTEPLAGGDFGNIPYGTLLEGLWPAAVFGIGEPEIAIWIFFQGNPGGQFRIELRKPNNQLLYWNDYTLGFKAFPQTGIWPIGWSGTVSPADYGIWTLQVLTGGVPRVTKTFQVGASTRYAPRFSPVAGRSFRINGTVQSDTLRVQALGGPATFTLDGAPPFVTLVSDSIVRIAATSTQPKRSIFFRAIATNAFADRDTMWYHVVDHSKPLESPTGVGDIVETTAGGRRIVAAPNPFVESTTIDVMFPGEGAERLTIVDVAGRVVRRLELGTARDAGLASIAWDGRDSGGARAPAGVYFLRVDGADGAASGRVLRLR